MTKEIIFHHHPGLGDHFICNGMVHNYAKQFDKLYLPCRERFLKTVECLYRDYPNIIPKAFDNDWDVLERSVATWATESKIPYLKIGYDKVIYTYLEREQCPPKWVGINFERQFYEQAEVLYSERYNNFKLPKQIEGSEKLYQNVVGDVKDYILVHDSSSESSRYSFDMFGWRNGQNSDLTIIRIQDNITDNLLQWIDVIRNAKEIHVSPSSVFCLVDSICKELKPDLYFHDIRADCGLLLVNSHLNDDRWNIVEYDEKI
jgi:hypothetical protein